MKLYVDDERTPRGADWILARTVHDAIRLLATQKFTEISLDHDDGHDSFEAVAYFIGEKYFTNKPAEGFFDWMEEEAKQKGLPQPWIARPSWYPKIYIHSANPIGAKKMHDILGDYGIRSSSPYVQ